MLKIRRESEGPVGPREDDAGALALYDKIRGGEERPGALAGGAGRAPQRYGQNRLRARHVEGFGSFDYRSGTDAFHERDLRGRPGPPLLGPSEILTLLVEDEGSIRRDGERAGRGEALPHLRQMGEGGPCAPLRERLKGGGASAS